MKKLLLCCALVSATLSNAQSAGTIYHELEKLNFLGSVLYIAAHPDDENTALISHFANHVHAETAYLSLTRGDGGQNLIGTELKEQLGVIRTNELLQARKIDGGQQYFSSAIDFGFSKNPKETLAIWDKKQILGEVIARIRSFQPDIIIHRFDHRTPGRTHGHHTTSAQLGYEAFSLTNNPQSYPKQLDTLKPWQAKRQFFNTAWWFYGSREKFQKADKTNLLALEIGNYDPILGRSNSQVAAASRSSHKSQGFGSSSQLGDRAEYIEFIQGDRPKTNNPFDGINTSWSRLAGGEKIGRLVDDAITTFDFTDPSKSLDQLLALHKAIEELPSSLWKTRKLKAVKKLIRWCSGLTLQLNAEIPYATPNERINITLQGVQQSAATIEIETVGTQALNRVLARNKALSYSLELPLDDHLTTPYWLKQKGNLGLFSIADESLRGQPETPPLMLPVSVIINGQKVQLDIPIQYRTTDPVRGELVTPFHVLPPFGIHFQNNVYLSPDEGPQTIQMEITTFAPTFDGEVELCFPNGWSIDQAKQPVQLNARGNSQYISYTLTPTPKAESGTMGPLVHQSETVYDKIFDVQMIDYNHIPKQYIAQPCDAQLVRLNLTLPNKKIGYLMGAGDLVPNYLRAIGLSVEPIDINTITQEELEAFDTVLVGIRAYNVLDALVYKNKMLFDFAEQGGTLIVQYTTSRRMKTKTLLPYPLQLSRDRVTDEKSPVRLLQPKHQAFQRPHKIIEADFEGWIQERGLYFANEWDSAYTPLLGMNDPGETEKQGSLLVAPHGQGTVVYTGLSFFRELPAGVPGAYRLLLNLINL